MSSEFEVVIRLPKSDGFHTRDDKHLANIARDRIEEALMGSGIMPTGFGSFSVGVREVPGD